MTKTYIARYDIDGDAQLLCDHLKNVGYYTSNFLSGIGLSKTGMLLGLLHDLGKYCPEFQNYLKSQCGVLTKADSDYSSKKRGEVPHADAGAKIIKDKGFCEFFVDLLAMPISLHHNTLMDMVNESGDTPFYNKICKPYPYSIKDILNSVDADIMAQIEGILASKSAEQEISKIVTEILKQNDTTLENLWEKVPCCFYFGMLLRLLYSALIDADRLDAGQRELSEKPNWTNLIARLDSKLVSLSADSELNILRKAISDDCFKAACREQGVYRLAVPTGGGKSYSSIRFALNHAKNHQLERVFYIAPFTSIIEQNAAVIREALQDEEGDILLEHHSNILSEVAENEHYKMVSENWDSPLIFTSMVQFLEAIFSTKSRSARRFHMFSSSVIIIDEVQSLPLHMIHIFNNAINFLTKYCHTTVVLSSATQPCLDGVNKEAGSLELANQPDIVSQKYTNSEVFERTEIKYIKDFPVEDLAQTARKLEAWSVEYGSLLFIGNSKKYTKELFQQADSSGFELYHLSTNMCPAHRSEVLSNIKNRLKDKSGKPLLVFSTSLIEAGVDVDFACVVRALTGADSIAQAAGRCNREGRSATGQVYVIPNPNERNYKIPDYIKKCADVCSNIFDTSETPLLLQMDIYYRSLYATDNQKKKMHYMTGDKSILDMLSNNRASYSAYRENKNSKNLLLRGAYRSAGEAFEAIESFNEYGIIVPWGEGADFITNLEATTNVELFKKLLRQAQQYAVNISKWQLEKLAEAGAVRNLANNFEAELLILDERYYDQETGISMEESTTLATTIL